MQEKELNKLKKNYSKGKFFFITFYGGTLSSLPPAIVSLLYLYYRLDWKIDQTAIFISAIALLVYFISGCFMGLFAWKFTVKTLQQHGIIRDEYDWVEVPK